MKKKISLLVAVVLLLTMTTGCRKKNTEVTEATSLPATEAVDVATQETELETTAPTVDVLKEAPSAFEDKPEETTEQEETAPLETIPPETKPLEEPEENETPEW